MNVVLLIVRLTFKYMEICIVKYTSNAKIASLMYMANTHRGLWYFMLHSQEGPKGLVQKERKKNVTYNGFVKIKFIKRVINKNIDGNQYQTKS